MPKLNHRPPKLSKEGKYAVVYCGGGRVPMGRWGTAEAEKNYRRFLAEWASNESSAVCRPGFKVDVDDLVYAFLAWAEPVLNNGDFSGHKTVAQILVDLYAGVPVDEFGPKALAAVQHRLETSGRCRGYCNKLVGFVRTMFRWGVSQEMVKESTANALQYVLPLREGRSIAPESVPREDVPDEVVERTLPYLLPTTAAMVRVQRFAVMRPNEVCRMRVGDLDRSGEIWIYRPGRHKGKWRGHHRAIALGRPEQELLARYILGKTDDQHVFSPRQAMEEKRERYAENRKWPQNTWKKKKSKPRVFKEEYSPRVYANSIKESIKAANKNLEEPIPHWTPYQLRHTGVTEISEVEGEEIAQAVAGRRTPQMTRRYDHSQLKKAVEQAKKRGKSKDA